MEWFDRGWRHVAEDMGLADAADPALGTSPRCLTARQSRGNARIRQI
jgi:hypothetical protein